ncbi:hypothetical protein WP50_24925 [Lactiplantibacillus plantarum]|nr:hypothetical protein WP50_24925 [Lactiplantibacillus plantarum]
MFFALPYFRFLPFFFFLFFFRFVLGSAIKAKLAAEIAAVDYPLRVTIENGNNPKLQAEWTADLKASFPDLTIDEGEIGPVVGVHVGEGVMGLIWARDWEKWTI